jgi:hypothetical protein
MAFHRVIASRELISGIVVVGGRLAAGKRFLLAACRSQCIVSSLAILPFALGDIIPKAP